MAEKQQHIIHRQIIEAKLPAEKAAIDFQQRISLLCEQELPKILNRLFDKLDLDEQLLHIPRLEIDIGSLPPEGWEQVFLERCAEKLKGALEKRKQQANRPDTPLMLEALPKEDQLMNKNQQILLLFFEFLRFGSLQSSEKAADFPQFEENIRKALREAASHKRALQRCWAKLSRNNDRITERLVKQFSLPFIREMANLIWELDSAQWEFLRHEFLQLLREMIPEHSLSRNQQDQWLAYPLFSILPLQKLPLDRNNVREACTAIWKKMLSKAGEDEIPSLPHLPRPFAKRNEAGNQKESGKEWSENGAATKEESDPTPDFFIDNGGLIIVGPFLTTLFQELKLTDGKEFTDSESQEKAIQLTQYLVTGEEHTPEFLLPLNKLLCGWPLAKPLIRSIELTLTEKEEAEDMLQAVIQHWGKIGQSSVTALRETFLQRKATLRHRSGYRDWHLNVERKSGIDILVERVPWTISLIKLPWMPERIQVEWV